MKSVYMYELTTHWRRHFGVARVDAAPSLSPGDGLDSAQWAANELGGAPLGDKRLSARLVSSAALLASCPGHALTAHDRAAVKGYYRLIDHPAHSQVTPANIEAPHRARTVQRMRECEVPHCDAELMFTDMELRFLADYAVLPAPCDLAAEVRLVAILGGYQNRKHDPPPGHQLMWRGYERMSTATRGYRIAQRKLSGPDST